MAGSTRWLRNALAPAVVAFFLFSTASAQETGVLRVTVVLTAGDGTTTPIPRVVLLVSDNPATREPWRIRTGAEGAAELKLAPGSYTVESDRPVMLGGMAYTWTQMIEVSAGRDNPLVLTAQNAEIETGSALAGTATSPTHADAAVIFSKWGSSVVELWTPTTHATGFVVHEKGLIATNLNAIGEATSVDVEFAPQGKPVQGRMKISGRVVATDRPNGVAIVWVDPAAVASLRPVPAACDGATAAPVEYEQRIVTIAAPMLAPRDVIQGTVGRVESRSFEVDWRLAPDSAGAPVFADDGTAIGLAIANDEPETSARPDRREASRVVPVSNVCGALAAAQKTIAGATPPAATPLRVESATASVETLRAPDPKAPRLQAPTISASSFDIALMTPTLVRAEPTITSPRTDFGYWTEYVAMAPPVLLVRVTPQFEESLWKTIARGAAQTQGVALPPLKSFGANFLRLRAFCDSTEVAPIHPFIIERRVSERATIREGLYVFEVTDFSSCGAVRMDIYSEKATKADTRSIDPKVFALLNK